MDNIHDKFIREKLEDKDNAIAFLNVTLPADVLEIINLDTLHNTKESFISEDLKELFTDIVYDCKLTSGEDIFCTILIEHKSYRDPYAGFQIGSYLFAAYRSQIKTKKPLKIIIPLLFYHHAEQWEFRPIEEYFIDYPDRLKPYIPKFETIFFDVKTMTDESIMAMRNMAVATMLLSQKHLNDIDSLLKNLINILESLQTAQERNSLKTVFVYVKMIIRGNPSYPIYKINNPLNSKFMTLLDELLVEIKEDYKSEGRQEGIEEGRQEGIQKGRQEGMQEGMQKEREIVNIRTVLALFDDGLEVSRIVKVLSLSEDKVNAILKDNNRI